MASNDPALILLYVMHLLPATPYEHKKNVMKINSCLSAFFYWPDLRFWLTDLWLQRVTWLNCVVIHISITPCLKSDVINLSV
jgi:hypothetical protein